MLIKEESPREAAGLFSVLVWSYAGVHVTLRQVAWLVVAAAALGAGQRLKNHIAATTSHGKDRRVNQWVGALEWAVHPSRLPSLIPGLIRFPFCSELWHRGEEWQESGVLVPPLWTPECVQGLCRTKVFKQYFTSSPRDAPTAPFSFTHSRLLWGVSNANPCVGLLASGSEILIRRCKDINWRQFKID